MLELTFKIKKTVVVRLKGNTDKIFFDIEAKSGFPQLNYPPVLTIEIQRGYAEFWLKNNYGVTKFELIEA